MITKFYIAIFIIIAALCIYNLWNISNTDQNTVIHSNGEIWEKGIAYHDSKAYDLHRKAIKFIENKSIDQAEETILNLISDYPDYVGGYIILGSIKENQYKLDEAKQQFLKAINVRPDHHQPFARLANVEAKLGNCDEALKQFKNALDIEYNYAKAHYGIAYCHYQLKNLELVKFHANKTIDLRNDLQSAEAAEKLLKLISE